MKNDWRRIFAFEELAMTDPQKSVRVDAPE